MLVFTEYLIPLSQEAVLARSNEVESSNIGVAKSNDSCANGSSSGNCNSNDDGFSEVTDVGEKRSRSNTEISAFDDGTIDSPMRYV